MKKIVIILLLVIAALGAGYALNSKKTPSGSPSSTPEPSVSQNNPDFKNATYIIEGKTVRLINGQAQITLAPNSASKSVVKYFGNEASGDLNGDNTADVAFLLTKDDGGSGTFYYVVVAMNEGSTYQGTNGIYLGDRIAPQTTEIREGRVIVNYADRNTGEPMTAAPSRGVSRYLEVRNGTLAEVSAPQGGAQAAETRTYASSALGISFQYAASQGGQHVKVSEQGDKVYVYIGDNPTSGQFVEVFQKKSSESFEDSIRRQILAGYSQTLCSVETSPKGQYVSAQINYPAPSTSAEPYWANYEKCNKNYDRANGIRYFLYDPGHSDKFLFFDIGQYSINASDGVPWQDTISIK